MIDCNLEKIKILKDEIRELEREIFYTDMAKCLCQSCIDKEMFASWNLMSNPSREGKR